MDSAEGNAEVAGEVAQTSVASRASHRAPRRVKPEKVPRSARKASAKPEAALADVEVALADSTQSGKDAKKKAGKHRRLLPNRPFWQELPILIVVALLAAYLVKTFVFQVFYIPSGSMENTLRINDRVLVDKVSYNFREIKRGEIIVFNAEGVLAPENAPILPASNPFQAGARALRSTLGLQQNSETDYIKRVIGLPGDRVQCCDDQGRMTVNGVALSETAYLYPSDAASLTRFDVQVPPKKLWVMGDHRSASADSRSQIGSPGGGFVPENRVVGRAFVVTFPFTSLRRLSIPETFQQPQLTSGNGSKK